MRSYRSVLFTASLLLPACGDKPDDSTGLSGGADTTAGSSGSTATAGSTGATDPTGTSGDVSSSGSDTTPTSGSTGASTTEPAATTTGGSTGDPSECAELGAMQCADNGACQAVEGSKLNLEKMCVGKAMFFACIANDGCGEAETVACAPDVDPPEPFRFPTTCLPPDWQPCDAPQIDMPCK